VVTGLSTTALGVQADVTTLVPLLDVVAAVSIMTHMQSLVLSDIGLSGAMHGLPSPGFEALKQLRHLDISHNPGITGNLPKNWFTLSDLQILDISYTGITGTLPAAYAALQNMQEFRAVNCTGITGQLPPAWGLLPLEVLEITNSGLSGTLPKEWTDAAAMRGAAMEVAAAMHAEALDALHDSYAGRSATIEPASLALEGLRVLDLSVSLPGKGGMSGALPEGFSTLTQLQVCGKMLANVATSYVSHIHPRICTQRCTAAEALRPCVVSMSLTHCSLVSKHRRCTHDMCTMQSASNMYAMSVCMAADAALAKMRCT
jgi:hypothetical protein